MSSSSSPADTSYRDALLHAKNSVLRAAVLTYGIMGIPQSVYSMLDDLDIFGAELDSVAHRPILAADTVMPAADPTSSLAQELKALADKPPGTVLDWADRRDRMSSQGPATPGYDTASPKPAKAAPPAEEDEPHLPAGAPDYTKLFGGGDDLNDADRDELERQIRRSPLDGGQGAA